MEIADPNLPVNVLKGVGPSLQEKFARLGIFRILDLLLHLPSRYQDRSRIVELRELRAEREALVVGEIVDVQVTYGQRRSLLVTIEDRTGYLGLRFFHFSRNQSAAFRVGAWVQCFGQARFGREGLEMAHPEYRVYRDEPAAPTAELTPVYPTTKGLGQARLRSLTAQLLTLQWPSGDGTPYECLKFIHRPPVEATADAIESARVQIALDELTAYYLVMRHRQAERAGQSAIALPQAQHLGVELLQNLGFELTGAQRRVVREVLEGLALEKPMLRLLQGDVGSGKTVIAAFAAIRASEHAAQTALMAPTEILAEQHYLNFSQWLTPLGIEVVLLTGSQAARERSAAREAIANGTALVAVGTHALFQDQVEFQHLALTIVDEQHRFGVHQRMALRAKGTTPHQLVMTATPIPRTLTMALYADMEVSILDELPAGRLPIETRVIADTRRAEVITRVAQLLTSGQQVYWVCPLIDDSEQLPLRSVEATAKLLNRALPQAQIGVLHGRVKSSEKAEIMAHFKDARLQLLVATTVIEVGVDVPNATLMVIENPERMGLAQLHQLRGRVGRGSVQSHCVLLYKNPLSAVGKARLQVVRDSQDGFYIAEQDLQLRGPGELLGARQTGEQQFRIADLFVHSHMIPQAVRRGDELLTHDPETAEQLLSIWAPQDSGHSRV